MANKENKAPYPISYADKERRFEHAIFCDIDKQIEELDDEVKRYREEALNNAKEELLDQLFLKMQEEIHKIKWESRKKITSTNLESYRKLLQFRSSLEEQVFQAVYQKLDLFVKSNKYKEFLLDKMQNTKEQYPLTSGIITVKQEDMQFKQDILKIFGSTFSVKSDPTIQLGGFMITSEVDSIIIDELLENTLEEQREWFYQNSNLAF